MLLYGRKDHVCLCRDQTLEAEKSLLENVFLLLSTH